MKHLNLLSLIQIVTETALFEQLITARTYRMLSLKQFYTLKNGNGQKHFWGPLDFLKCIYS